MKITVNWSRPSFTLSEREAFLDLLATRVDASHIQEPLVFNPGDVVRVNFAKLDFINAGGINTLLILVKRMKVTVELVGLKQPMRFLFSLTNTEQYFFFPEES